MSHFEWRHRKSLSSIGWIWIHDLIQSDITASSVPLTTCLQVMTLHFIMACGGRCCRQGTWWPSLRRGFIAGWFFYEWLLLDWLAVSQHQIKNSTFSCCWCRQTVSEFMTSWIFLWLQDIVLRCLGQLELDWWTSDSHRLTVHLPVFMLRTGGKKKVLPR